MAVLRSEKLDANILMLMLWFIFTCLTTENVKCTDDPVISPFPKAMVREYSPFTLTCIHNGSGKVQLINWHQNGVDEGFIQADGCTEFGFMNITHYNYSCSSDSIFTWTVLNVTEEQHGNMWLCEMLIDQKYISSNETIVFVQVPVQHVIFVYPSEDLITVNESQVTTFKCITSEERPRSQILWFLNDSSTVLSGASITPEKNYTRLSTTGLLRHAFNRQENGRELYCTASNVLGEATRISNKKKLNVHYSQDGPPLIHKFPNGSIYKMVENTVQNLYCSVSGGNPLPALNWNCSTEEVVVDHLYGTTVNKSVEWTATRDQVQDCVCTSDHPVSGILSSRLRIEVLYPPNTTTFSINGERVETVKVVQGRYLSIKCESKSKPAPGYSWSSAQLAQTVRSQHLNLTSIDVSKVGNYTCTARNVMEGSNGLVVAGAHSAYIVVDVLYPPSPPDLWYSGAIIADHKLNVIREDNVSISCTSDGNPRPQLKWTQHNSSILQFFHIQTSNKGRYTCSAMNTMLPSVGMKETGKSSNQIYINVMYPPSKPSFDVNGVPVPTVVVVLGRYAAVGCTSLSNPIPLYEWTSTTFDGSVIGSNFSLMNVEVKNAGNYTCTAKNFMLTSDGRSKNGSHSADISLIVQYPPTSPEFWYSKTKVFGEISVLLGDDAHVSCESDGNPSPKVTWNVQNNATLQFQAIQLSNMGQYTCTSTNTLTPTGGPNETITMAKAIYIDVKYGPSKASIFYNGSEKVKIESGSALKVIEGKACEIICSAADGNPSPSYSWSGVKTSHTGVLKIFNISRQYSGKYTCHAKNTLTPTVGTSVTQYFNRTLNIDVFYPPTLSDMDAKFIRAGSTLSVLCFADSNPACTYRWARYNQTQNISYENLLNMSSIGRNDSGIYTCIAENTMDPTGEKKIDGISFSHLKVIVLDLPKQVEHFHHITSTTTTAMISWTAGANGGRLQTFFIEFKPAAVELWLFGTSKETDNNKRQHNFTLTGLEPGTEYEARIVSGNAVGNSSHSETISFTTTKELTVTNEKETASTYITVVLAVCAVLILILVVTAIIILHRKGFMRRFLLRPHTFQTNRFKLTILRNSPKNVNKTTHVISRRLKEPAIEQCNGTFEEKPNSEIATESFKVSSEDKIPVKQLWHYLRQAHSTDYENLLQEYQRLPSGRLYDCIEASRAENSKKNRYRDIIPYDRSRVILQNDQANASTYINASYIDGYTQGRKFIASQGPTDAMVPDFWDMVLQEHSSIIVMLTNLIENGAKKCIQYWPDEGENRLFGDITVTTMKITAFPDYVIRELDVCKEGILTRVVQIHFTAWPDKAVPSTAWHLVNFWRNATSLSGNKTAPVIVHCSAGVGRTGTYIALDNLYTQAKSEGYIQPFDVVKRMREQRMSMVQTEEQYIFLHEAIAEALYLGMKPLRPSEFAATFTSLLQTDNATGRTGLEEQFQWLNPGNVAEDGDPQYSNLLITKESDEYRPKRVQENNSAQSGMELSYIQNCAGKVIFLVTKSPEASSVDQLHKLIAKHNIRTVINLSDSIQVHSDAQLSKNGGKGNAFNEISFSLNQESDHSTRTVKEFVFHAWKEESLVPKDTQSVIALLNAVQSWQPFVYEAQPILLHCNSGYVKSGLVCVLLAEFERIRIEEEANILETVKRIKERNPRMVQHYEQYKFCYLAVSDYIRQFDVYMNV